MTPDLVLGALSPTTAAVIPVLHGGRPVDLSPIHHTLNGRGIVIIEDAAHAFGSRHGTRPIGAARDVLTCFSFGPTAPLTCGQGGMLIPRTPTEAATIRRLRDLGHAPPPTDHTSGAPCRVSTFGLRYHLSPIHAAIGLIQLDHIHTTANTHRKLWRTYQTALSPLHNVTLIDTDTQHAVPHRCHIRLPHRDQVLTTLQAHNIAVAVHYPPNHLQPAFTTRHHPSPTPNK